MEERKSTSRKEITCETCGLVKSVRKDSIGRFCSKRCWAVGVNGIELTERVCSCGAAFHPKRSSQKYCHAKCPARSGPSSAHWRGGRYTDESGYVLIRVGGRYVYEHRVAMEKAVKRELLPHENVHHKNGDRADNRIENLELWSTSQPAGQRVEDKVAWAVDLLSLYAPEKLGST